MLSMRYFIFLTTILVIGNALNISILNNNQNNETIKNFEENLNNNNNLTIFDNNYDYYNDDDDDANSEESFELNENDSIPIITTTATTPIVIITKTNDTKKLINKSKIPIKRFNKLSSKKRIIETISLPIGQDTIEWKCPNITSSRSLECTCDLPHTLRCSGDIHGLSVLAKNLRDSPYSVSLLDCSLKNVTILSDARIFENISLHGLVISSGEIKRVHKSAFIDLKKSLQALGLPGNALLSVPWNSIAPLLLLERLDLSNNRIKALGTTDFSSLQNLNFLDLSDNQISSISMRAFVNLKRLDILKLGGNRLGDYPSSLRAIGQCYNLRQLDLRSNSINGPLNDNTLPTLRNLDTLNLERNLIKSIQNKALQNFTKLLSLSLRHNQIDVLQDHAFYGLGSLELLDLSYNGIVAISSSSLKHLTRLKILDLTHNFLRALTSDLIIPLPSLKDLRLAGNDISIIAKNALNGAKELISLSLDENPLSCDCSIKPFAEWLQESKLISKDLISATCVTPPRLEGAPLIQIPIESLHCDQDNIELDNDNIIQQLELLSKQNLSSSSVNDLSEKIILKDFHFSTDYGLILTWTLHLSKDDYMCDAIFVYKEENINEILIDNSPIHCESKIVNGQNTVSVIVPDSSALDIGESYRFCLVLLHEKNAKSDLVVGCSNVTKLQLNDNIDSIDNNNNNNRPLIRRKSLITSSDISNFDRISTHSDEITNNNNNNNINNKLNDLTTLSTYHQHNDRQFNIQNQSLLNIKNNRSSYDLIDSLNKSFFPGLGLGILVTSIFILIWGATRIRNNNRLNSSTSTTCYTASDCDNNHHNHNHHLPDLENGNRYLKLQATSSL